MLQNILMFGSFTFWVITVGVLGLGILLLEELEQDAWATFSLIGVLIVFQFYGPLKPLSWIWHHLGAFVLYAMVYFVIGTVWSVIKWHFYLLDEKDRILYRMGLRHPIAQTPESYAEAKTFIPRPEREKARIVRWMAFWPWSMAAFFFSDFVKRIFRAIYEQMAIIYQKQVDYVFSDFSELKPRSKDGSGSTSNPDNK